jgi:hypothetical protein
MGLKENPAGATATSSMQKLLHHWWVASGSLEPCRACFLSLRLAGSPAVTAGQRSWCRLSSTCSALDGTWAKPCGCNNRQQHLGTTALLVATWDLPPAHRGMLICAPDGFRTSAPLLHGICVLVAIIRGLNMWLGKCHAEP